MYWNTNSHPGTHSILIKFFAAFGYVNDASAKTVVPWTDCFFEHDGAARGVLGNCPTQWWWSWSWFATPAPRQTALPTLMQCIVLFIFSSFYCRYCYSSSLPTGPVDV